jgi:hypothetical protein
VRRVAANEGAQQLGGEDLAALGRRAEARRLDDTIAVVVAFVLGGLAHRDTDAHRERLGAPGVVALDALLDPDRTRERTARARVHQHQAVARALDLEAAGVLGGGPQDAEVRLAQLLGRLGSEARGDRGGIDEISEDKGPRDGCRHVYAPALNRERTPSRTYSCEGFGSGPDAVVASVVLDSTSPRWSRGIEGTSSRQRAR